MLRLISAENEKGTKKIHIPSFADGGSFLRFNEDAGLLKFYETIPNCYNQMWLELRATKEGCLKGVNYRISGMNQTLTEGILSRSLNLGDIGKLFLPSEISSHAFREGLKKQRQVVQELSEKGYMITNLKAYANNSDLSTNINASSEEGLGNIIVQITPKTKKEELEMLFEKGTKLKVDFPDGKWSEFIF